MIGPPPANSNDFLAATAGEHGRDSKRQRSPIVAVAVSFAVGICLETYCPLSLVSWWIFLAAAWGGWLVAFRRRRTVAAWFLCFACVAAGGLRQHWFIAITTADNIALFARETPQPVRLTGTVTAQPVVIPRKKHAFPSTIPEYDRTFCKINCQLLLSGETATTISGTVRLQITGHAPHIGVGDEVEVVGLLSQPVGRRNPGGFDFRDYLHSQGIDAMLRTDYPDAVQTLKPAGLWWQPLQFAAAIREECNDVLTGNLSPDNAPVAAALLLGDRRDVTDDQRNAFAQSGTMHFLALSGLHVGILATLLWGICRLFRFPAVWTTVVILSCLVGYTFINEARLPVIRATVMAAVILIGQPWHRRTRLGNSLALAALVLLLWNPAQLFEVGPQLSFLAVVAIVALMRLKAERAASLANNEQHEPKELRSERFERIRRWTRVPLKWTWDGLLVTAAIWLIVAPLIAARFHMVSPVGLVVNVLLMPLVIVVLWCGYALLFCGLFIPPLTPVFGFLFDNGLSFFLAIVDGAQRLSWGHQFVPGPANWWLVGFYALLVAAIFGGPQRGVRRWGARGMLCFCVLGLAVAVIPHNGPQLRCTFFSVGHGSAILVELPGGRTLLYDAGQLHDAGRTERIIENGAWELGIGRLDAVVLSHADVDHFNAVPGLMDKLPVAGVYVSPSLLDTRQPAVVALCDAIISSGIPLHSLGTDDQLLLDDDVDIRVLVPAGDVQGGSDNANSLVLSIEYRERVILLTGDLEGEGLLALFATPSRDVDVLSSPHHGSLAANTSDLAAWCRPQWVIASGGRKSPTTALREIYGPGTDVLSTWTSGAVTVTIDDTGRVDVREFVK